MPRNGYRGGRSGGSSRSNAPYSRPITYTWSGRPVSNPVAYEAAGWQNYTPSGAPILDAEAYANAVRRNRSQCSSSYRGGRSGGSSRRSAPYSHNGVHTPWEEPVRSVAPDEAAGRPSSTRSSATIHDPISYARAVMSFRLQRSSNPPYYYHYCDNAAAEAIRRSGRINPSRGPGDCALGEGVYVTAKAPNCSRENILNNNYGTAAGPWDDRADAYVRIPAESVEAISGQDVLGRDVYVIRGAVDLESTGAEVRTRRR